MLLSKSIFHLDKSKNADVVQKYLVNITIYRTKNTFSEIRSVCFLTFI